MPSAKAAPPDARTRILDAAVDQLRRHGPAKTGVVDVARALGISHAAVYRQFDSKQALFDAVAERWLTAVSHPLKEIAARRGKAARRLEEWLTTLIAIKRRKATEDPELFATYHAVTEAAHNVVSAHVAELQDHLRRIIADGVASGEFKVSDPAAAAAAVLHATSYFHHPHFVRERPADPAAERRVVRLVLGGLASGDI
ncbi:MAG: TetR family transcriptional regulator [Pseudorhodoplanes sp.]|nr:TetR family transcriptional regulator [Pseudorhodoplanes sp.]